MEAEWENMLTHQLPALPSFEQFWIELPEVMEWLHGDVEKVEKEAIFFGRVSIDEIWPPPSGGELATFPHKSAGRSNK